MRPHTTCVIIAAATAIATGCTTQPEHPDLPNDPMPQPAVANTAHPTRPPQVVEERACGAFGAIDQLARDAISPSPDPVNPAPHRNGTTIITYANALQTLDRQGISRSMDAALGAHAYALTNLGALINHNASREDIASMATVAETTAHTVQVLCEP
jgi:hypothetical protein